MDSRGKTGPIQLDAQQQKAVIELEKGLQEGSDANCSKLLRQLLLSLYAPKNTLRHTSNIFSSPVIAFLALQCKTEEGAYHKISRIGEIAAKIQTCIRLRCLGYLADKLQESHLSHLADGGQQEMVIGDVNDDWIEYEIPLTLVYYTNL